MMQLKWKIILSSCWTLDIVWKKKSKIREERGKKEFSVKVNEW